MTINYTSLLGLAQPVTGTESGTWGTVVNDEITALLEEAVAGGETIDVTAGNVTLTTTNGAANQARNAILLITGTPGTSRNVVAPSSSKVYVVVNDSNGAIVLKGSATTGVTIAAGSKSLVAWNGSDFVEVGQAGDVDGPSSATDNAVARFDGTTGKLIQNSAVTIADTTGDIAGAGSITSTSASGILTRAASTQDGVIMAGRAGGTSSYAVTLTPTTLSASRTLTLPDASGTILQSGTAVTVAQGGTGLTAGTSGGIPYFSSTSAMTSSGVLTASAIMLGGGAGAAPTTTTTGTGVVTALGVAVGSAGAFVVNGGALGTPSSGTVTNLTGTASININGTVGATTPNTGAFTSITSTSASGISTIQAATQDGVKLIGRAGGTGSYAVTLTPTTLSSSTTLTLPNVTDTLAVLGTAQTFTAAQTFRAANAIRSEAASTQDAIVIAGRAGGTSSYAVTLTPATLSASRTVTLADGGGNYTLGYQNVPDVGSKTSSYTLATTDVGKYVQVGSGGSITIPDATFADGDVVSVFNNTSAGITITCSITTAYISGTDSDKATVTLATRGVCTILFISSTVCVISGSVS